MRTLNKSSAIRLLPAELPFRQQTCQKSSNQSIVERSLSPKNKKVSTPRFRSSRKRIVEFDSVLIASRYHPDALACEPEIDEVLEKIEDSCPAQPHTKISNRSKRSNLSGSENAVELCSESEESVNLEMGVSFDTIDDNVLVILVLPDDPTYNKEFAIISKFIRTFEKD